MLQIILLAFLFLLYLAILFISASHAYLLFRDNRIIRDS